MRYWFYSLALFLILMGLLLQFVGKQPVETDLMALLPDITENPVVDQAANRLTGLLSERMVFLVGHRDSDAAKRSAERFSGALRGSGVFKSVQARINAPDLGVVTGLYAQYQNGLLVSEDANILEQGRSALTERLVGRLVSPFSHGMLSVSQDPFGFFSSWLARLPYRHLRLQVSDGWLTAAQDDLTWVLVSTNLAGSPFDSSIQEVSMHAADEAAALLRSEFPDTKMLRAGAIFHSTVIRQRAEQEINYIGGVSLVGIIALLLGAYRSGKVLGLGLLSICTGIAAGLFVTITVYGRIHLMTLIFGASLLGEAIDYSIQYFSARLGAGAEWEPNRGLRTVLPRLAIALLTSLLGYLALMLTPFPILSQIGVFAISGLFVSFLSVAIIFPSALPDAQGSIPERLLQMSGRLINFYKTRIKKRHIVAICGMIFLISMFGFYKLTSNDDIKLLVSLSPELVKEEQTVRELTGVTGSSQFLLVEGSSAQEVLEREEALQVALAAQGIAMQGVSSYVPSCSRQAENRDLFLRNISNLKAAMQDEGFTDNAINALVTVARNDKCLAVDTWLASPISKPFEHFWIGKTDRGFASVVMPMGFRTVTEIARIASGITGVMLVDKPGMITKLIGKFRGLARWTLVGATIFVYLVLVMRYGLKYGSFVLLPTVLSLVVTASLFGHLDIPLTLFHVLALILVLGVGINYSIFLVEGCDQRDATTLGVLLSVVTTFLSFGLLSFSSMPAAHNFGLTLAIGIFGVALLSPISIVLKEQI
jgi:predicted exporter